VVTYTMLAFSKYGFNTWRLVFDGASSNLSILKTLCGHKNEHDLMLPWFKSPIDGCNVHLIICASHQVFSILQHLHVIISRIA
jgi:hypothetical protein